MEKSKTQSETLSYFNKEANNWNDKMKQVRNDSFFIAPYRNEYVIERIKNCDIKFALDIGCGTGNLVRKVAKKGGKAIGLDFSEKMINIAKKESNNNPNENYLFCSIFNYNDKRKYDLITANGVIEYMDLGELEKLLNIVYDLLNQNGLFIFSARNRLYNMFSLNDFTKNEIKIKNHNKLLEESLIVANCKSKEDMIKSLTEHTPIKIMEKTAKSEGVSVSDRIQFTPSQICNMLARKNLFVKDLHPIHIHGLIPKVKKKNPELHNLLSKIFQKNSDKVFNMLPFASTFMVESRKCF